MAMMANDDNPGRSTAVSHIGLCVSDLERSLRFYTEGLGFEIAEGWDISGGLSRLAEVDGEMLCRSQMIVNGPAYGSRRRGHAWQRSQRYRRRPPRFSRVIRPLHR